MSKALPQIPSKCILVNKTALVVRSSLLSSCLFVFCIVLLARKFLLILELKYISLRLPVIILSYGHINQGHALCDDNLLYI